MRLVQSLTCIKREGCLERLKLRLRLELLIRFLLFPLSADSHTLTHRSLDSSEQESERSINSAVTNMSTSHTWSISSRYAKVPSLRSDPAHLFTKVCAFGLRLQAGLLVLLEVDERDCVMVVDIIRHHR